jgi:hypothetical protein
MSSFDSSFENEISNVNTGNMPPRMPMMPPIPPPGMFPPMMPGLPPLPPPPPGVMAQLMNNNNSGPPQGRLPPRPAFVPHQLRHRVPQQSVPFPSSSMRTPQMSTSIPQRIPSPPPSQGSIPPQQPSTLSAQPLLYKNQTTNEKSAPPSESSVATSQRPLQTPVIESKPPAPKLDKPLVTKLEQNPHPVSKAFAAATQPMETNGKKIIFI